MHALSRDGARGGLVLHRVLDRPRVPQRHAARVLSETHLIVAHRNGLARRLIEQGDRGLRSASLKPKPRMQAHLKPTKRSFELQSIFS